VQVPPSPQDFPKEEGPGSHTLSGSAISTRLQTTHLVTLSPPPALDSQEISLQEPPPGQSLPTSAAAQSAFLAKSSHMGATSARAGEAARSAAKAAGSTRTKGERFMGTSG
jgi:hypothetical protein